MKRISLSQVKLKQTSYTAKNAGALANEAKKPKGSSVGCLLLTHEFVYLGEGIELIGALGTLLIE